MPRPQRSPEEPLVRRDADGGERTAPSWETLTERLIREAQQEGRFDHLPGHGQPLRLEDDAYAGEMAVAHVLRNAGAAPPWTETDKEVRELRGRIEALIERAGRSSPAAVSRQHRELEALAEAHDAAVGRLQSLAPTPRQHRPRLDHDALRERLAAALGRGSDAP